MVSIGKSRKFRKPRSQVLHKPGGVIHKTDDTDLFAMHRAAVNGFGVLEHEPDPIHVQLQLLARPRRSLVEKNVVLKQQMLERIYSYMPLYSIRRRDGTDRALSQGPVDFQATRIMPVAKPERWDRSL